MKIYEEEYEEYYNKCRDRARERMRERDRIKIDRPIDNYDKSPIREDDFESDIDSEEG